MVLLLVATMAYMWAMCARDIGKLKKQMEQVQQENKEFLTMEAASTHFNNVARHVKKKKKKKTMKKPAAAEAGKAGGGAVQLQAGLEAGVGAGMDDNGGGGQDIRKSANVLVNKEEYKHHVNGGVVSVSASSEHIPLAPGHGPAPAHAHAASLHAGQWRHDNSTHYGGGGEETAEAYEDDEYDHQYGRLLPYETNGGRRPPYDAAADDDYHHDHQSHPYRSEEVEEEQIDHPHHRAGIETGNNMAGRRVHDRMRRRPDSIREEEDEEEDGGYLTRGYRNEEPSRGGDDKWGEDEPRRAREEEDDEEEEMRAAASPAASTTAKTRRIRRISASAPLPPPPAPPQAVARNRRLRSQRAGQGRGLHHSPLPPPPPPPPSPSISLRPQSPSSKQRVVENADMYLQEDLDHMYAEAAAAAVAKKEAVLRPASTLSKIKRGVGVGGVGTAPTQNPQIPAREPVVAPIGGGGGGGVMVAAAANVDLNDFKRTNDGTTVSTHHPASPRKLKNAELLEQYIPPIITAAVAPAAIVPEKNVEGGGHTVSSSSSTTRKNAQDAALPSPRSPKVV